MSTVAAELPCINPATGEEFNRVRVSTAEEVEQARRDLQENLDVWRGKPVKERIRILRKLLALIVDSTDIISHTVNMDTGKSRQDGLIEVLMLVDRLKQYYRRGPRWLARRRVPPGLYFFRRYYTELQPFGVVAVIAPWNYPFELVMSPLCSALLAGNTVMVKPSEITAATGQLIEQLIQSVPELSPFVRVLHGAGDVGEAMVRSKPDLIFLTGSVATARLVALAAAENLTPCLFELGGKDPMIVLEDADVGAAAHWGTWSSCYNAGQTCVSIERVYVVAPVYEAFVRAAAKRAEELTVGYTADLDCPYNVAPLTSQRQKETIRDHLNDAVAKGARVLTGGEFDGMSLRPTVVVDVDHRMKLMTMETFGPIMPIMKVRDEEEAIRLANDSPYGLSASVWSRDLERAQRVSHRLEVGSVNINDATAHYVVPLLPFGGVKQSGGARTHGKQDILQFTQMHSYAVGAPPKQVDPATQLRKPGRYGLGKLILHLLLGVTPRQRVQPLVELGRRVGQSGDAPRSGAIVAAGALVGLAFFLSGLWRRKK
jgi:acyl-CoA reductase-like NAD-dependent aldehyde dehydrogenase